MDNIIIIDGECNLCHFSVKFIVARDPAGHFYFVSRQSKIGRQLQKQYRIPEELDSVILIAAGKYYTKSDAALRICKKLKGGWALLYWAGIIPSTWRDFFYDLVAVNRYRWFGQKDSCLLPDENLRNRFLS